MASPAPIPPPAAVRTILGLSAYYHDSAAVLLRDGEIVAAAQEERFTRRKHDASFPHLAIRYCTEAGGIGVGEVDQVVFYDKPLLKFERLLETYLGFAPRGIRSFVAAMPVWLTDKLFLKTTLRRELAELAGCRVPELPPLLFSEHHRSHAASAFFMSPFQEAAVLCLDGVGEWATTTVWHGADNRLTPLWEIDFPHSLGLLYSAFTYFTGFKVNSGEYKLMGLAPYGEPRYAQRIRDELVDIKPDGTFRLDMRYFDYCTGLRMTNERFAALFDGPPRAPETELTQREMDLAASIQQVTEEIVLKLAHTVHRETGLENLCLAGGVALNCVANGRVLREGPYRDLWIQPAAGDAGGALGAACTAWYELGDAPRRPGQGDGMQGTLLGPGFDTDECRRRLARFGAVTEELDDEALTRRTAELLAAGNVVGWFQGRMEFGPRALGARSILGDPRVPDMQSVMNLKIKFRESFRPFAPSVLRERAAEYYDIDRDSPYMLLVTALRPERRHAPDAAAQASTGLDRLKTVRSELPAVTHVDYSARLHTVDAGRNPRYHRLLREFEALTGCPVLVNTSFNVRGEPIVCTPEDAYRCFMRTAMDYLVIGNLVLAREEQPAWEEDTGDGPVFELD